VLRRICFIPLMLFCLSLQHNFVACIKQVKNVSLVCVVTLNSAASVLKIVPILDVTACSVVDRPFILMFQSNLLPLLLGQ
jgi:hypothetical protein